LKTRWKKASRTITSVKPITAMAALSWTTSTPAFRKSSPPTPKKARPGSRF
jgi:hypothetical protein